jgi:hypothetical protein
VLRCGSCRPSPRLPPMSTRTFRGSPLARGCRPRGLGRNCGQSCERTKWRGPDRTGDTTISEQPWGDERAREARSGGIEIPAKTLLSARAICLCFIAVCRARRPQVDHEIGPRPRGGLLICIAIQGGSARLLPLIGRRGSHLGRRTTTSQRASVREIRVRSPGGVRDRCSSLGKVSPGERALRSRKRDNRAIMSARRLNADMPLGAETKRRLEELKRNDPEAREHFEQAREKQLRSHPPIVGGDHTPAQKANATQMSNKAVAMRFLGWP